MEIALILQCINTWDFSWLKHTDKVEVFIDGVQFPHVVKDRGCRIIMQPPKPLPTSYYIKILAKDFFPFESLVNDFNLSADSVFPVELISSKPPHEFEIRRITTPATVVCGYDYYALNEDALKGFHRLQIKNPRFENIEGRRFLIRDTKSKNEEFIIIGDAVDFKLCEYKIPSLKYDYDGKTTALLPAFRVNDKQSILVKKSPKPSQLWVYDGDI